jgi:ubiquinone/menaquinone biosynthesis C-methylase UbiE
MAEFIFKVLEEVKPAKVLDVGCGRGFYVRGASLFGFIKEIGGIDINTSYINKAKDTVKDERVNFSVGSALSIPYPSKYFDFIICSELLEHLSDDGKCLLEIKRVMKKNAVLVLSVPSENFPFTWDPINWVLMRFFKTHINKDIWFLAGIWADHVRLYKENELEDKLLKAGFLIKKKKKIVGFSWPFTHFILYGIGKNLVERFGFYDVSRFGDSNGSFNKFIAKLIRLPVKIKTNESVNLCVEASKNS